MTGTITIRGMTPEELGAAKEDDLEYGTGFVVESRCKMRKSERVNILATLARSLHMDAMDMLAVMALVAGGGEVQPPWVSRSKEVIVRSPRDGKAVEPDDA